MSELAWVTLFIINKRFNRYVFKHLIWKKKKLYRSEQYLLINLGVMSIFLFLILYVPFIFIISEILCMHTSRDTNSLKKN